MVRKTGSYPNYTTGLSYSQIYHVSDTAGAYASSGALLTIDQLQEADRNGYKVCLWLEVRYSNRDNGFVRAWAKVKDKTGHDVSSGAQTVYDGKRNMWSTGLARIPLLKAGLYSPNFNRDGQQMTINVTAARMYQY